MRVMKRRSGAGEVIVKMWAVRLGMRQSPGTCHSQELVWKCAVGNDVLGTGSLCME